MSSSNCCFLTCIQVSQEAGQVVWYSHLLKNFSQFVVIHTNKGFGIVNKAEIDVFLELSCFFDDPAVWMTTKLVAWNNTQIHYLLGLEFWSPKQISLDQDQGFHKAELLPGGSRGGFISSHFQCLGAAALLGSCPILHLQSEQRSVEAPLRHCDADLLASLFHI